jgi:hypothetical protein
LQDEDGVLAELEAGTDPAAMATILICLSPRRVGRVMRRVLDVSVGTLLAATAELPDGQLAMVNNRVTTRHREFAEQWQEVA